MRLSTRAFFQSTLLLAMVLAPALAASCAHSTSIGNSGFENSSGSSGGGGGGMFATPTSGGSGGGFVPASGGGGKCSNGACQDFASAPIMDPKGMPSGNPATLFGPAGSGSMQGGPCLVEPADGALYPKNWLRPRVYWKAGAGQNLFEVRFHSMGESNDLVVYTTNTYWAMDKTIWETIAYTPPGPTGTPAAKDGNLIGAPIAVTVRGMSSGGGTPTVSNTATITIAPAIADGALVYWTTSSFLTVSDSTTLQGFTVGDEGTTPALTTQQVGQPVRAQPPPPGNLMPATFNQVFCIGCHTATPDGKFVSFTSQWPWAVALASIDTTAGAPAVGSPPTWLTPGAASNLSPNINGYYAPPTVNQVMMGIQTFSPAHYQTGDRKLVAGIGAAWNQTEAQIMAGAAGSPTGVVSQLAWFDLEYTGTPPVGMPYNPWSSGMATSPLPLATPCNSLGNPCATSTAGGGWGIIARTGDSNSAGGPNWSHNVSGTDAIAYGSTNLGTKDGRMDCELSGSSCTSDVYIVPYNGGMGGTAAPLPGASKPDQSEYYPAWSPDDQLIAFNRVPAGTSMYNANAADIYVVQYNGGMGGTEQALKSNTPVTCTGAAPGMVQNTWPKWAPNPLDPTTKKPVAQKDKNGNTYYWVTFSSTRSPQAPVDTGNQGKRKQQLYVAGIVVDSGGNVTTFAPIYLWNQDFTVNNLIPAWGEFSIPPGSIPPPAPTAL
ncbi:MAG TPA: hypothetical protein VN894_14985 [Polyangiaceae bacterium]|nr:hypothetical protein [Polyangiaceae bacterium]